MRDKQMKKMQMGEGKKLLFKKKKELIGRWSEDADEAVFLQFLCSEATYTTAAPKHRGEENTHKQSHTAVSLLRCNPR